MRCLLIAASLLLAACPGEFSPAPQEPDKGSGSDLQIWLDSAPRQDAGSFDSVPISVDAADLALVADAPSADQGLMTSSGFGEACGLGVGICLQGLICVNFQGSPGAYCTKICPQLTAACSGTPPGTIAGCLSTIESGAFVCTFVCGLSGQQYPCPGTLTCSTTPNPPNSTQYLCL